MGLMSLYEIELKKGMAEMDGKGKENGGGSSLRLMNVEDSTPVTPDCVWGTGERYCPDQRHYSFP